MKPNLQRQQHQNQVSILLLFLFQLCLFIFLCQWTKSASSMQKFKDILLN